MEDSGILYTPCHGLGHTNKGGTLEYKLHGDSTTRNTCLFSLLMHPQGLDEWYIVRYPKIAK